MPNLAVHHPSASASPLVIGQILDRHGPIRQCQSVRHDATTDGRFRAPPRPVPAQSANPCTQPTKEDQDKINKFSRLHQRELVIEEELKNKSVRRPRVSSSSSSSRALVVLLPRRPVVGRWLTCSSAVRRRKRKSSTT